MLNRVRNNNNSCSWLLFVVRHYSRIQPPRPVSVEPVIRVSNNVARLDAPKEGPKPRQLLSLPPFPGHPLPAKSSTSDPGQRDYVTAVNWIKYYFKGAWGSVIESHFREGLVQMEDEVTADSYTQKENLMKPMRKIRPNEVMKHGARVHVPVSIAETRVSKRYDAIPCGTLYPNADEIKYLQRLVIYKDSAIIVLNKPPKLPVKGNLPVHNSMDALAAAALSYDYDEGPKLVHRLDRETSGILLLGRTKDSASHLQWLFTNINNAKSSCKAWNDACEATYQRYWALVIGTPKEKEGIIHAPLSKVLLNDGKTERIILANHSSVEPRQEAVTEFRVLGPKINGCSWVELRPLTYRKHQLRVHCAEALGTPIVGDYKYGWFVHSRWKQMPRIDIEPTTGKPYKLRRPEGLDVQKGSVLSKVPLLHLHCRELVYEVRRKEKEREKYNLLRRRQIEAETEAWERMVEEYRELEREMRQKMLAPNLPHVKALLLGWFEPFRSVVEAEQKAHRARPRKQQDSIAPHVDDLPSEKVAVIVMHKMMAMVMENEEGCVQLVHAAVHIGMAVEQEVRIHKFIEGRKSSRSNKREADADDGLDNDKKKQRNHLNSLIKKSRLKEVQMILKKEECSPWSRDTQAKLGSRLIELLVDTAYVHSPVNQFADTPPDIRPAFRHCFKVAPWHPGQKFSKKYGVIQCDPLVLVGLEQCAKHMFIPYMPMLVPPKKWKGYDKGGHFFLPSYIMRTHGSRKQQDVMKSVKTAQMQNVFEALDILGNTKWRVNKRVLGVVESIWAGGGNIAGLVNCSDVPLPDKPPVEDLNLIQEWKCAVRKAKKINTERHSLRCDTELKLSVARKMKDEEGFYYPHNLDFRGRAYPMHPHLNHLGSDLCRGLLEFAEGKPLGKSGLRWLKIHVANLYAGGIEKLSYDGRLGFIENHINDIIDSADNPINGNRWWLTAEDPFQCLTACINLSEALKSSSPNSFISHIPVHQDGSCNGLQHYAALGRNELEAAAVNLVAKEKPADVYTEIAVRVHDIMRRDSNKDPDTFPNALLAKVLIDQIDRKLVKQTVMTSVYGVTFIGAREQIKRRLEEKGLINDDRLLYAAACYAAKVTLAALGEVFEAARGIMSWLGDCAKVIACENQAVCWTTPLGLPVVQPYCKTERYQIRTSLQLLALQREGSAVSVKKQRSAFPPNFVHSLDSSHMMMTALACNDVGLCFAGVHDSFWTHPCDVEKMNQILREKFVELYNMPILENLLEGFQTTYPGLAFPSLPKRGEFDLEKVLDSPYFFN